MVEIFNELARTIKGNTKEAVNNIVSSVGFELGTITNSGLKLDNFKYEVNYSVLEYLKLDNDSFSNTSDGLHSVTTPSQLKPLKAGDRVLVAIANKVDFIIVGRITNA